MLSTEKNERIRALWALGDWETMVALPEIDYKNTNNESVFYVIAALFQLGRIEEARSQLLGLDLTPEQKVLVTALLVSGTYNALAKAYVCSNNYTQAEGLCKKALVEISDAPVSVALLNARISEQFSQLGIPRLASNIAPAIFKPDAEQYLRTSYKYFSHEPAQEIALAEFYQLNGRYDNAIVHWQAVSGLLNTETPQIYYDRLKDAYKSVKGFPQGTAEQETLHGDTDKYHLLREIHTYLQPEFYFEIGVQTGKSLALAKCEAIGIDPMPMLSAELPATAKVITSSSDSFFVKQSDLLVRKSIDFSFIDGMHLFEYALRDFINVEKYAEPYSLIVIDDIFPCHLDQAKRERCTRAWTGDVWKVKKILEKYRPDLFILAIDAYPTGLLLISALKPANVTFDEQYKTIIDEYFSTTPIPDDIISRKGSISGKSDFIKMMINELKISKFQKRTSAQIKAALEILTSH